MFKGSPHFFRLSIIDIVYHYDFPEWFVDAYLNETLSKASSEQDLKFYSLNFQLFVDMFESRFSEAEKSLILHDNGEVLAKFKEYYGLK